MTDKTVVVTGASSGIGKEAAKALAAQGWSVIAHGRDPDRSASAEADIRAFAAPSADVHMVTGDLASLADTAPIAGEIAGLADRIHVILANAGGMRSDKVITAEGNEACFAGNHLGHFLLVEKLMPQLRAAAVVSPPGAVRVIATTSDAHAYHPGIDWTDLQGLRDWSSGASYCLAKLCNLLWVRELARREAGAGIVAHALHPGVVASNFTAHAGAETRARMATLEMQSPAAAAAPLVWLATSNEAGASTGLYWNRDTAEEPAPAARDDGAAARLWAESEALLAASGY